MATRATSGGNPPGAGHSGTRGSSGRIREVKCFALHSEHVAGSEGISKKALGGVSGLSSGTRGALARHPGKWSRLGTRGHVSASERSPEGGVRRASFRKGLPEGFIARVAQGC